MCELKHDLQVTPKQWEIVVIPLHILGCCFVDFDLESAEEMGEGEV